MLDALRDKENPKFISRGMFLFTRPGQVAKLILADGFRFVMFIHGEQPKAVPIDESGPWEIDIPALLAKGRYPVGIMTVDAVHVRAFEAMPAHVVDEMLDAALSGTKDLGNG